MGRSRAERGQALVAALLAVIMAGVAWDALLTGWALTRHRMVLQGGLDAGATAGAAVMADALNTLAITNAALLGLGVGALLGSGESVEWARRIQRAQDEIIRQTPGLVEKVAIGTSALQGAHGARLSRESGDGWPSLMVRRVYFLPGIFGKNVPLWIADDLTAKGGRRWGDRVVKLSGWRMAGRGALAVPLRAGAGAAASRNGGGHSSLPLLSRGYDSRLIPLTRGSS